MTPESVAMEALDALVRRLEVLEFVLERPREKPEMVDALDVSRSTVDRAVRDLETHGFLTYSEDGYTTTTLGELTTTQLFNLVETIRVGTRLEPFLDWVPAAEFGLELRYLADADLYVPQPNNPYAMVNRHVKVVAQADHQRLVLPLVGLHGMEAAREAVLERGADCELVVAAGVAETLRTDPDFAPLFEEMKGNHNLDIYVYDENIPYFVGILDEKVQIGVDEGGEPRALVESERDHVRAWATTLFEAYRRESEPLR